MARARLEATVGLNTTRFSRGLGRMRRMMGRFRARLAGMVGRMRSLGRVGARMGLVIAGGIAAVIKQGNGFRVAMAEVSTMLGDQQGMLKQLSGELLTLSSRYGMATDTLAKGLYDILSAGIPAANAMNVLEVATRAAIGGATDTATSVDALTTVLNAYGMQASEAAHVSDVLFQVVKDGKITYSELAENIGKLAPTAKAAGMSLEDMSAAVATMVKVEKPERAMTALRAAMIKAAEEGITLFDLLRRFEGASLEEIIGAGISRRAAQGVAILANNMDNLRKEVTSFQNVAGNTGEAFQRMDAVRHWPRLWRTVVAQVIKMGSAIDEKIAPAINWVTDRLQALGQSAGFQKLLERMGNVARDLAGGVAALISGGQNAEKAMSGFKKVFLGVFQLAGNALVKLLLRVAPTIGMLIGKAASGAMNPFKRMGVKSAAKAAGISFEEQQRINADIAGEQAAEQFGGFGTGMDNLKRGMELLSQAAMQTIGPQGPPTGQDTAGADGGAGAGGGGAGDLPGGGAGQFGGDRFTSLRRIGANVLRGMPNAADNANKKAERQRQELIALEAEVNENIKKMKADFAAVTGAISSRPPGAVF